MRIKHNLKISNPLFFVGGNELNFQLENFISKVTSRQLSKLVVFIAYVTI